MAALAREYLDRSVKTPDDVEEELGLTFLGLLPEVAPTERSPGGVYGRRRAATAREIAEAVQRTPELMAHLRLEPAVSPKHPARFAPI